MCEEIIKQIYETSKHYGINKINILTNHLKFAGTLCESKELMKNDCLLTLSDVKIWRLDDICNCGDPNCKCDEASFCAAEWLHVNVSKIVAFTLKK